MSRPLAVALACALAAAACTGAPRHPPQAAVPTFTISPPRYTPAPQTGWMHGVGIDVPPTWPRDRLRCGQPWETTLVVEPVSAVTPLCLAMPVKGAHPDVAWLGAYLPPLRPHTVLGLVEIPSGGLAAMTPTTIDTERAWRWQSRDFRTHEPALLVVVPSRRVFVEVASVHSTIRDAVIASIRFVPNDPATGCAVRTTAYDAPPQHPRLDRRIDVAGAVGVVACHYVAGWLEKTVPSMPAAGLRALVRAIDAAPHVTSALAPVDAGCQGLDRGPPEYDDDGPVVLRFSFPGGRSRVVVGRVTYCTRWQSYLYSGDVERRMTGAVLRALPRILDDFPGPDTM
jgi:hypothetical protein